MRMRKTALDHQYDSEVEAKTVVSSLANHNERYWAVPMRGKEKHSSCHLRRNGPRQVFTRDTFSSWSQAIDRWRLSM
eukprot:6192993-Pleurochrysis_carterae.AAC.1